MPIVAAIVGLLVMVGCVSAPVPESSLTGKVHEVKIGEVITPKEVITAKTGDEIRWVNTKSSPVHLTLKKPVSAGLSCRKGFASTEGFKFVGSPDPDVVLSTTVNSNGFVSLCFSDFGIYNYAVTGTALEGTVMVK
jgi:plastocyanin